VNLVADTLSALAHESRRVLIQRLALGPATSGQLSELLTGTRPATVQHLRVLADSGLVRSTAVGRHHWYELSPGPLFELERWLTAINDVYAAAPTLTVPREPSPRKSSTIARPTPPEDSP
jgi:DNA-binding transcriptional ArsR family regulator